MLQFRNNFVFAHNCAKLPARCIQFGTSLDKSVMIRTVYIAHNEYCNTLNIISFMESLGTRLQAKAFLIE